MPAGIRVFLVYGFLILGLVGLSLRFVVDQAISAPVSPLGVVVMVLLAYTIFTMTLVFQRKEAARGLALGLASLTLPAIPLAWLSFVQTGPRIAATLFVTERAVEKHTNSIFAKLGLSEEKELNRRVKAVLLFLAGEGS